MSATIVAVRLSVRHTTTALATVVLRTELVEGLSTRSTPSSGLLTSPRLVLSELLAMDQQLQARIRYNFSIRGSGFSMGYREHKMSGFSICKWRQPTLPPSFFYLVV